MIRIVAAFGLLASALAIRYACDPCLDRSGYRILAIVHGTASDPFWQQIRASAFQSAKDMRVDFEMKLYDSFNVDTTSQDISSSISNPPDALVVTIPSSTVSDAVKQAIEAGIPTVGLNVGASFGKEIGALDFVSSNDKAAGEVAAEQMISLVPTGSLGNVLYVNDEKGNIALEERLAGFTESLQASNLTSTNVQVNEVVVDGTDDMSTLESALREELAGCTYQAVLLSGTRTVPAAIAASEGCSIPLGAFDTSESVFDAIGTDGLAFTVGQQQALQGALSVLLAALYATTGMSLASSANSLYGEYLTGPKLITKATLPTDTEQVCEVDAFPVCPNTKAPNGTESECDCTERSMIKIGGVTHAITTDSFWEPVYAASEQAAQDMGVQLFNERWPPEEDESVLHTKMANQIRALCTQEGVDGLFVSIPSDLVVDAIQECLDLNIPVMSINAGAETSKNMSLMHHIGQLEYNAGFGAGEFLAGTGISRGLCINHAEGVNVVLERCAGFKDAVESNGVTYIGEVFVPDDNQAQYIALVEEAVGDTGDWEGLGILAAGGPQHVPVIALQARHDKSKIGAFDVSSELYEAVDVGIKEFGIDQQAYLQGYMPVALLTYAVSTGQTVENQVIESGPAFVESSPSDEQVICEEVFFAACQDENASAASTTSGDDNKGLVVGLSVVAVVFALAIGFLSFRMHKLNKHVKELESQGQEVPPLSLSQRVSGVVKPVSSVVSVETAQPA